MSTVFWLPRASPRARPPAFGTLAAQGVSKVGGIFYPVPAGHGTMCGALPLATLYAALESSTAGGQEVELWIQLPTINGSIHCGIGPLTDLTQKAAKASLHAWTQLVHNEIGTHVKIRGVFIDVDGSYYPPLPVDAVRALMTSLHLDVGLIGDPDSLPSFYGADVYLARSYTVSRYNQGSGSFPLGSPTAFAVCDRADYCSACMAECGWTPSAGASNADCVACKMHQCSGRSGMSMSGDGMTAPAQNAASQVTTLDLDLLSSQPFTYTPPVFSALQQAKPTIWKPYDLPAAVVPPAAPLSYKYGATIAMSRWFHDSPHNPKLGPIMACSPDAGTCSISQDSDAFCNIGNAYAGFVDTLAKTSPSMGDKVPVAFLN